MSISSTVIFLGGFIMADLIVITGPLAVGKMTVAEELREKTGYNLMINHDSIEVSDKIFGFATPAQKEFNLLIRESAFATTLKYNENMIFTIALDFDNINQINSIIDLKKRFEKSGGRFYFVELFASLDVRMERNVTPHRLEMKKSKQDIEWSKRNLLNYHNNKRMNTNEDEYLFENHLKINNENLSPQDVVKIIIEHYKLTAESKENNVNSNKMY